MDILTPTSSPILPVPPAWASALTPADLDAYGLAPAAGKSCVDSLTDMAEADDIDLVGVTRCLELLRSGPYLLHMGAPLALMSFNTEWQRFWACDDGEFDDLPTLLTEAQAGLWLSLVSSEVHPLPAQPSDWGVIRLERCADGHVTLHGQDTAAIEAHHAYADVLTLTHIDRSNYDQFIARAVWTCVRHALDGV